MAKRYYQGLRDRLDESRADHRRNKYNDEKHSDKDGDYGLLRGPLTEAEDYMGMPTSMRRGLERPEMIYEDRRAIANLPQEVMIKAYPRTGPYMPEAIDDTGRGVDRQIDFDDEKRREHFYPKKV